MLSQALDTHELMKKPKDREWMHTFLNFLSAYVQDIGSALLMQVEDKVAYMSHLVAAMKSCASEMDSGLSFHAYSYIESC
jgi:trafficking protein particle complex subunit 10